MSFKFRKWSEFSRIIGEQRKDGILCEMEGDKHNKFWIWKWKKERRHSVWKYYKKSHFFKIIQELFYEPWKDENKWFETFSNSLQSEIIVNEKCSVLFVIICYHHLKNCCFNQKVLCNFLIRSSSRIFFPWFISIMKLARLVLFHGHFQF